MKVHLSLGGETTGTNAGAAAIGGSQKICLSDAGGRNGDDLRAVGAHPRTSRQRPLRILLSYHYYKDENLETLLKDCFDGVELDVFADSGAFSAFTMGTAIVADEYIAWVKRWQHLLTAAAGPDVIGDAKETTSATEKMLGEGLIVPVLPTFHVGEDWTWLDYWQGKVDYMAFGGMVPYTRQRKLLDAWLRKAFSRTADSMRVHGFGMTTWPLLLAHPWYSVDSSSWTSGFRYAQLLLFDRRTCRMASVSMADKSSVLASHRVLEDYGVRPDQVLAANYDRDLLCGLSVESWQRAEEWLNSRRVYIGLSGEASNHCGSADQVGRSTKVYLASSAAPGNGHGNGHASSVGNGIKTYLACGADKGAPNRPAGIKAGLESYYPSDESDKEK